MFNCLFNIFNCLHKYFLVSYKTIHRNELEDNEETENSTDIIANDTQLS